MVSCLVGLSRPPWRMSACRGSVAFWVTCVCRHGRRQPIKTQDWIPSQVILKRHTRTLTDMHLFFLITDQCAQCKLNTPWIRSGISSFYHEKWSQTVSSVSLGPPNSLFSKVSVLASVHHYCPILLSALANSTQLFGRHGQHWSYDHFNYQAKWEKRNLRFQFKFLHFFYFVAKLQKRPELLQIYSFYFRNEQRNVSEVCSTGGASGRAEGTVALGPGTQ